jgi:transposase
MTEQRRWFVGIDWARDSHHVRLLDELGQDVAERIFDHSSAGLHAMSQWLLAVTGALPADIHVAIEVPHGPIVEMLLERGFQAYAINPKQLDRLRDRFSLAGAKDDSLDCLVLGSSLRTDPHCFRKLDAADPAIVELREWSKILDIQRRQRTRLNNRLKEQLWRYFPALLQLEPEPAAEWLLDLWHMAPHPAKAARLQSSTIAKLLKRHRIRRLSVEQVLAAIRQKPVALLPGTAEAAIVHVGSIVPAMRMVNQQIRQAEQNIDRLIAQLARTEQPEPGQQVEQPDAAILASLPGAGRTTVAKLLTEPGKALHLGNYQAIRALSGTAPVTKRSGRTRTVSRRLASNPRLVDAVYHWARVATQIDPICRAKYKHLRSRGHSHGRALRSVADRLLNVACAMMRSRTLFDPNRRRTIALAEG